MKEKILYLVIGILIGAIITASCFLLLDKNKKSNLPDDIPNFEQMDKNGEKPELPEDFDDSKIPDDMKKFDRKNSKNNENSNTENKNSSNESI